MNNNVTSNTTDKEKTRDYWSTHMRQWEESNLSQEAYCTKAGIKYNTFVYWRGLLRSEVAQATQKQFIPVLLSENKVTPSDIPRSIQIKLLTGHIVSVPLSLDIKEIATLIHLLGARHA
jgi:hypothetical protein